MANIFEIVAVAVATIVVIVHVVCTVSMVRSDENCLIFYSPMIRLRNRLISKESFILKSKQDSAIWCSVVSVLLVVSLLDLSLHTHNELKCCSIATS